MPVASSLQKVLGAPALLLPMGQVRYGRRAGWLKHARLRDRPCRKEGAPAMPCRSLPALPLRHLTPTIPPYPTTNCHLQASDCPHLANERIRRLNLLRGKNVVKNILMEVGAAGAAGIAGAAPQQQQQQQQQANGGVANGAGQE